MKKKLIVTNGKGGVGKSTIQRALIHLAKAKKINYQAFDGDASNASLARFYPESIVLDVDGDGRIKNWFENAVIPRLLDSDTEWVLLDLGSGGERLFRTWCLENEATELLAAEKIEIVLIHVMDPTLDSISPLLDGIDAIPDVRHVLVFNLGMAKGIDAYEPEKAFAPILKEPEFIEAASGRALIKVPPLLEAAQLDAVDLSFDRSMAADSPLNLFERMRVKRWIEHVSGEFLRVLQ